MGMFGSMISHSDLLHIHVCGSVGGADSRLLLRALFCVFPLSHPSHFPITIEFPKAREGAQHACADWYHMCNTLRSLQIAKGKGRTGVQAMFPGTLRKRIELLCDGSAITSDQS